MQDVSGRWNASRCLTMHHNDEVHLAASLAPLFRRSRGNVISREVNLPLEMGVREAELPLPGRGFLSLLLRGRRFWDHGLSSGNLQAFGRQLL